MKILIELKNVNLKINEGESTVIIGPSGGGKTILLKTMAGIIVPKEGDVFSEGENLKNFSQKERVRRAQHLGMHFQKSALFDSMNCFDNIAFPLREQGHFSENEVHKRVTECLEAVNLSSASHLFPHEISGGMRQRLGIARAIAMKPNIIFYDDPTAGLDPIHSDKIVELIINLKIKYQATVVIVTHSMDVAYRVNGRMIFVANQKVTSIGNNDEVIHHPSPEVQQFIQGSLIGPLST